MGEKSNFDTLIVGNGALGLALGYELTKSGNRVAIVGPRTRPGGASVAAGAMNGCFGEITTDLFASSYGREKFDLDRKATALWSDWAAEIAAAADIAVDSIRQERGTTVLLNTIGTQEIDSENFWLIKKTLEELDRPHSLLDESDVPWINPHASCRSLRAIHIPDEHHVLTQDYLSALEIAFVRAGGHLLDATVAELTTSGVDYRVTLSDGSQHWAWTAVLAAGAYSHGLLRGVHREAAELVPPMVSGSGVSVLVKGMRARPLEGVVRTPNRAFACGLHAVARANSIYVGATNSLANTPRTLATMNDLHFLMDCAMKQIHTQMAHAGIAAVQVGNRPVPIDGFPLIGRVSDCRLWMLTGTYRDGFHQSPLLAKLVAKAICDDTPLELTASFKPERPPIQAVSRDQAIEAAVKHMIAAGFETDWRIPSIWTERLKKDLVRKFRLLADELHHEITPPADVLAFSESNPWLKDKLCAYYARYTRT